MNSHVFRRSGLSSVVGWRPWCQSNGIVRQSERGYLKAGVANPVYVSASFFEGQLAKQFIADGEAMGDGHGCVDAEDSITEEVGSKISLASAFGILGVHVP